MGRSGSRCRVRVSGGGSGGASGSSSTGAGSGTGAGAGAGGGAGGGHGLGGLSAPGSEVAGAVAGLGLVPRGGGASTGAQPGQPVIIGAAAGAGGGTVGRRGRGASQPSAAPGGDRAAGIGVAAGALAPFALALVLTLAARVFAIASVVDAALKPFKHPPVLTSLIRAAMNAVPKKQAQVPVLVTMMVKQLSDVVVLGRARSSFPFHHLCRAEGPGRPSSSTRGSAGFGRQGNNGLALRNSRARTIAARHRTVLCCVATRSEQAEADSRTRNVSCRCEEQSITVRQAHGDEGAFILYSPAGLPGDGQPSHKLLWWCSRLNPNVGRPALNGCAFAC